MTLFAPGDVIPTATPLDVAHAYLGVQETSRNRGPLIDEWVRFVGLEPDGEHPWCAAFASWVCWKGNRPVVKGASVRKLLMRNGDIEVSEPMPGDLCIHLGAEGKGHVGFFIRRLFDAGRIETIDGNTNEKGSREGNAVAIVDRPIDYWHRFLRPTVRNGPTS
jgi:hypothetical protein